MDDFAVTVNGRRRPLPTVAAHTSALDWLRETGLSGVKEGCAEGECGACAMLLATPDDRGGTAWTAVNACLVPVAALNGQEIVTSEGLGSPEALHPVQETLAGAGGSQCGYCTPGFVCSMADEYYRADRAPVAAGEEHAERGPNGFELHALSGNLCRCTGYRPIRDAAYSLGSPTADDELAARRARPAPRAAPTDLRSHDGRFIRPATLVEALGVLGDAPDALLVAGSTDVGVEVNLRGLRPPLVVAIDQLDELRTLSFDDDMIEVGAALTLSEVERRLGGRVPLLAQFFPQFASRLIRNRATFGGNLGTGSPIGDAPPALLALGARLVLASSAGEHEVELSEYFTGYRQTVRRPDEIIRAVRIPLPLAGVSAFHKIAKRRFDDISSVALGFALDVDDGVVTSARIGLGGVAATPLRALATEAALVGETWNIATVRAASQVLAAEGTPISDHRASSEYRSRMLGNALLKLYSATLIAAKQVPA
ncbi:xanthine dehydrogenase small subunit [Agromyces cerinus]|uniref:xanthine dehydrogenase small subunit n=1 Tax=Agromyces cerinus TaxID=33878 RepID=UPI0019573EBC|nr:FAD binding domain-containing protein [Agromyces cerinus]MBM7829805.1 xanthine dehydrogenase small subunit [Agromyces cerinus]